jgi:AraC-like DNA-binding protein
LRHLRQELGRAVEERPDLLGPRFDRYLEAVASRCGFRIEAARGQLEAGFERIAEPLVKSGALDAKSFEAQARALDRTAANAPTLNDLFGAYRRAVSEIAAALQNPVPARQDRALQRALEYIQQHYAEPLRSDGVARVAGFARTYFSRLFRKREKVTFEHYLRGLRLERAKQLLADTDLDMTRVAELAGFRSPQYFSRVFRKATRATPVQYRIRAKSARDAEPHARALRRARHLTRSHS